MDRDIETEDNRPDGPGLGSREAALELTALADGESGRVVGLSGGTVALGKLEAMGILVGAVIEKKSSALRRGPIVIGKGRVQVALAYAIAKGILVEPLRYSSR